MKTQHPSFFSKFKRRSGFGIGIAIGLLFMLALAVATNPNTIIETKIVSSTAESFSGRLGVCNLDGSSLNSLSSLDWGGFALYQTKNWTVVVTNTGSDVLNVAWGILGINSIDSPFHAEAFYGTALNSISNIFEPTDLTKLQNLSTGVNGITPNINQPYIDFSQQNPYGPFVVQIPIGQSIYVRFELEKIASTVGSVSFRLEIVSLI